MVNKVVIIITKPDHIFMMAIIDLLPSLWAETKTTEQNGSEYATVADICKGFFVKFYGSRIICIIEVIVISACPPFMF